MSVQLLAPDDAEVGVFELYELFRRKNHSGIELRQILIPYYSLIARICSYQPDYGCGAAWLMFLANLMRFAP